MVELLHNALDAAAGLRDLGSARQRLLRQSDILVVFHHWMSALAAHEAAVAH